MSSGESGAAGEFGANIQQSMKELASTEAPMDSVAENSSKLAREIEENRLALSSVLGFFQALPERLAREFTDNYTAVQEKYEAVATRTLPILYGTENPDAVHAGEYIRSLRDTNPSWIPIGRMEGSRGRLPEVIEALRWLVDKELPAMTGNLMQCRGGAMGNISTAARAESSLRLYRRATIGE